MVASQTYESRREDDGYEQFSSAQRAHFEGAAGPLFTTSVTGLYDAYLAALPPERRQHYACRSCRDFVERYGGLVTIGPDGTTTPALWPESAPGMFGEVTAKLRRLVSKAPVDGVFLTDATTWGTPKNTPIAGPHVGTTWHHLHVVPSRALLHRPTALKTCGQASAEKSEEFGMLARGLAEFPLDIARQALTLLTSGQLQRSEKCEAIARWFVELHEARGAAKDQRQRTNLTWLAIAKAPVGFAHVRSSMIGTLLEDIAAGSDFTGIKRRFDEKVHPLQYQRPQAPPTAGNIAQAEKVVAALGIAPSLRRRYARVEELEAIWRPAPAETPPASAGVFAHLVPKGASPKGQVEAPPATMTWEKFARVVLPEARQIECVVPGNRHSFGALVTAADLSAPPILQWDREDRRNPVSWYMYVNGSFARDWNLVERLAVVVDAIALRPSMWFGADMPHQGKGLAIILRGAKDLRWKQAGSALFPETLKSELREIRATIEAHSQRTPIEGADEASACGLLLSAGQSWNVVLRVTDGRGQRTSYMLDRWD